MSPPKRPDLRGSWTGRATAGAVSGPLGHAPAECDARFTNGKTPWTLTIDRQEGAWG